MKSMHDLLCIILLYLREYFEFYIGDIPLLLSCMSCHQSRSFHVLELLPHVGILKRFRCYEVKKIEKVSSRRESNPGHLACAASALPLSYDNRTNTSPHNSLYINWTTTNPHNPLHARVVLYMQYMQRNVRAGVCPVIVAQWQSTGCMHKPSVLGYIHGNCWPFYYPPFSPQNI